MPRLYAAGPLPGLRVAVNRALLPRLTTLPLQHVATAFTHFGSYHYRTVPFRFGSCLWFIVYAVRCPAHCGWLIRWFSVGSPVQLYLAIPHHTRTALYTTCHTRIAFFWFPFVPVCYRALQYFTLRSPLLPHWFVIPPPLPVGSYAITTAHLPHFVAALPVTLPLLLRQFWFVVVDSVVPLRLLPLLHTAYTPAFAGSYCVVG